MSNSLRLQEDFTEYIGEAIMSNFDRLIIEETAEAIYQKKLFSDYPGWDFNGKVWWQDGKWHCEVWCYGNWNETFSRDTLKELMEDISDKYGSG